MIVKHVTEAILTSCLLLSRVWARPADLVCDGGRGEWDKWFDGCRWCICQQGGPSCSSSECSRLVTKVAPCQKVDSRWWDGCYHCKCYHHGIECTVDDTCLLLMHSDPYALDFLSPEACLDANDGRCICGADGVPSCTAEVIDRKAHPATTVGLNPVFPAAASIVSPKVVFYDKPYAKNMGNRPDRPHFYTDSLYRHHPGDTADDLSDGQRKKHLHFLVKRHSRRTKNYSPRVYISVRGRKSQLSKHRPAVDIHNSSSHNRRNSRKHSEDILVARSSHGRRKDQVADQTFRGGSDSVLDTNVVNSNQGQWEKPYRSENAAYSKSKAYENAYRDRYETFGGKQKELEEFVRLIDLNVGNKFKKNIGDLKEGTIEAEYLNDGTATENAVNVAPESLLVASDNRCRWGVRWYGGSLRCYCGPENSITCGDPSFVASRIDGFRVEPASCEVGQAWDDANTCRACDCQVRGVVLCRRSSSCPLPFLIKPLPVDPDFDRKYDDVGSKGQSSVGHTDEFTGQEEQKVVFDKEEVETGSADIEGGQEGDVYDNTDSDNITTVDTTDGKIQIGGTLKEPHLIAPSENMTQEVDVTKKNDYKDDQSQVGQENINEEIGSEIIKEEIRSESNIEDNDTNVDTKKEDSVLDLDVGITNHPNIILSQVDSSTPGDVNIILSHEDSSTPGDVNITLSPEDSSTPGDVNIIHSQKDSSTPGDVNIILSHEDSSTPRDVNINVGEDDGNKKSKEAEKATTSNKLDVVGNTDFKRTTQVAVGECRPMSRWLDRCKRCQCDKDGKKHCDDSRCPKPMTANPVMINSPVETSDIEIPGRPMQRPPAAAFLPRNGPINLKPTFLGEEQCGRFTVGQKYWDECNICLCTSHGPKCTAKNCA